MVEAGNLYWRISTIDLFVLISLNIEFLNWKHYFLFYKTIYFNEEINGSEPSHSVSVPWLKLLTVINALVYHGAALIGVIKEFLGTDPNKLRTKQKKICTHNKFVQRSINNSSRRQLQKSKSNIFWDKSSYFSWTSFHQIISVCNRQYKSHLYAPAFIKATF